MPPRKGFGLSLKLPADGAPAPSSPPDAGPTRADGGRNALRDSFEMGSNGAVTMLSKSITPYQFSSEGLIKAASRQQPQHHYRVSEQDIFVIRTLGRGASSVVFKGFLVNEAKFVALKKINILQKETRQQMMNDIKALCGAPSVPGLICFHGAYHVPDSGQISIVLEFMDGGSLADVLKKVGIIPEPVLSRITGRVLQGLAFLHRKHLVHRDIKPANILMNLQGEAKISDFGISAFVDNTVANCNTFTGTVTYMSPERIEGKPYSFPADIWSLGLVLLEAATGRYPYDANGGPVELMIQILHDEAPLPPAGSCSEELRDFVRCCLATDPKRRPRAEQLLQHPFIVRHAAAAGQEAAAAAAEGKRFMACMLDPLERMDEISFQFAWMYYAALSKGQDGLRRLGGLYSPSSLLHHQGAVCCGRDAIMARQQAAAGAGGPAAWRIKAVDSQPLGVDGTMLLQGQSFAESFILKRTPTGEYFITNQALRTLFATPSEITMAEDAAAPGLEQQQEAQEEQQQDQATEEAGAALKKRDRDDEEEAEPDAKRPNTNGEGEEANHAAGGADCGDPEGGDCPQQEGGGAADPPGADAAGVDGGDCPGPAGAADPAAGTADAAGGGNPGPGGHGNPGPGAGAGAPAGAGADDREYTVLPDGSVSEVMHIAKTMVGKLIGKAGATIMGLQTSTGVSIQVDQTTATRGGECRRVTLKGGADAVEAAKAAVEAVLAADAPGAPAAAGETSTDVKCPQAVVGRIIGRAGETIKLLQGASGAYILVNQNFPDGEDRVVTVSGTADAVERASNMIKGLISSDQVLAWARRSSCSAPAARWAASSAAAARL
ncbi:MAG: kinase-like domain-containing protein [Monoraphidium minutum]|nr:MAG: kinase-like domain-containing protein [Monoraphidium minutum]